MAQRVVSVRLQAVIGDYQRAMQQASQSTDKLTKDVDRGSKQNAKNLQAIGTAGLVAGGALALGLGKAVTTSAGFEKQLSGVGAVSDASAAQMARLGEAALKAGASTKLAGVTASDAARAEAELVKAGVSVSDVLGGALTGSLSLASAGQIDFGKAAEISAQAMNIFNLRGNEVGMVADVLAAAANKSAADVDQLGQSLQQGGLVASQLGLSMEETVGTLALFADNALVGSDAGTSLKTMLQRLTPQSAEAAAEMDRLGFSAFDAQGEFIGMEQLAREMTDSFGQLTTEQRGAAFATIFGSDAVRAASVLYTSGEAKLREYNLAVLDEGAAARMAAKQMDNLSGDIEAFGGAVETALIKTGSQGNTVLREMVQEATNVVSGFSEMPAALQGATLGVGALSSAGLLALGTYGTLIGRFKDTTKALSEMGTVGQFVGGNIKGIAGVLGIATVTLGLMSRETAIAQGKAEELLATITEDIDMSSLESMRGGLAQITGDLALAQAQFDSIGGTDPFAGTAVSVEELKRTLDLIPGVNTGYYEAAAAVDTFTDAQEALQGQLIDQEGNLYQAMNTLGLTEAEVTSLAQRYGVDLGGAVADVQPALASAQAEMELLSTATHGTSLVTTELSESQKLLGDAFDSMLDPVSAFGDALDDKKAATRAFAEQQAEATGSTAVEWQDMADNVELSLNEYAASLEEQNANVANWQDNLVAVAQRVGPDVALALTDMGDKGVDLTAKMASGTIAEAERMAAGLREQAILGGDGMKIELDNAMRLSQAIAATGGKATVDALAAQLNLGVEEVRRISAKYGIVLSEGVKPVVIALVGQQARLQNQNPGRHGLADGAVMDYYAQGGMKEDHVAQIARAGDWRVWAEDETGGEAYIPLAPSKRARSLSIWEETGRRLGISDLPQSHFADGGFHKRSDVPLPPGFEGFGPPIRPAGATSLRSAYDAVVTTVGRAEDAAKAAQAAAQSVRGIAGSTTGLVPWFLDRFNRYSAAVGGLSITSGFRSRASQERLYALYLSGRGNLAARPGTSMHEKGLAIDHAPRSTAAMRNTARGFRLHYPVRGEPWHVEPFAQGGILNPHVRDQGGPLMPGYTLNGTGRPERVVSMHGGGIIHEDDPRWDWRTMGNKMRGVQVNGRWMHEQADGRVTDTHPFPDMRRGASQFGGRTLTDAAAEAARAAEEAYQELVSRQDNMFAFGALPLQAHLRHIDERMEREEQFSDEWMALHRQREQVLEEERRKEEENYRFRVQIHNNMFELGQISLADHLSNLDKRIARERYASDEWMTLVKQREDAIEQDYLRRREINDNLFELGRISLEDHLGNLDRRMQREEQFTDEWMALYDERERLTNDAINKAKEARDAFAAPVRAMGDLVGTFGRQDLVTGDEIVNMLEHRVEAAKRWDTTIRQLSGRGFDKGLIDELAKSGPQSLGLATGLLGVAPGTVNSALAQLTGIGAGLGGFFGPAVPAFNMSPTFNVSVFVGDREITDIVRTEVSTSNAATWGALERGVEAGVH